MPTPNQAMRQPLAGRDAVIRVYDETGRAIETHERTGDFKGW
jgi:hypothetical protein